MKRTTIGLLMILGFAGTLLGVQPPEYINYQGVLRDAGGEPLDGAHDMVFNFYDADGGPTCTGGTLLLTDSHQAAGTGAVTVAGGLFNVHLGDGATTSGLYATMADAFANKSEVWLEVQVGTETLCPRVRVIAAPYALNAGRLGGKVASGFLDTSSTAQTKTGQLTITSGGGTGIEAHGTDMGGYFEDMDGTGSAYVGMGDTGIYARGAGMGGYFLSTDNLSLAAIASGGYGISADGFVAGGHFLDGFASGEAWVGYGNRGIEAQGTEMGGYFEDKDGTGSAYVGMGDTGIYARGAGMGGYFLSTDNLSLAQLASGDYGIWADGYVAGGHFLDSFASGEAWVGYGNRGIEAQGTAMGGYFEDKDGTGYANVGIGNRGIEGFGSDMGGYFKDTDQSGYARVGYADKGIEGYGSYMGGYFKDTDNTSDAKLAWASEGIHAYGETLGGKFEDLGDSGIASVAVEDRGILAYGDLDGGYFGNYFSGVHGRVATDVGDSFAGNGVKAFVQNHPYDEDKRIHYASLEGDEVGTYTRGVGRLEDGVARIPLGETFQWVTHPDIGLTAQLTARGRFADLYVESLTTEELVVRSAGSSAPDVAFDYVVNGLRIGFEEIAVVRTNNGDGEAHIPSMDSHRDLYVRSPELRRYNALERFRAMRVASGEPEELDLSAGLALRDAIGVYDPAIHDRDLQEMLARPAAEPAEHIDTVESRVASDADLRRATLRPAVGVLVDDRARQAEEEPEAASPLTRYPASEPIEAGELVALDLEHPGRLRRASGAADPAVFGIAAGEVDEVDDESRVELVESRYAEVKADASYGAILPGDLLVSSPTPGHAMRAIAPLPGTVVGKAAEGLDSGTGSIRVLVMLR